MRMVEPAPSRGEFRYVFYTQPGRYQATVNFYSQVLGFDIRGGFPGGTYLQASAGIIEVIDPEAEDEGLKSQLLAKDESYAPPRGGFLLIEVPDVDALAQRTRDHRAPLRQELVEVVVVEVEVVVVGGGNGATFASAAFAD